MGQVITVRINCAGLMQAGPDRIAIPNLFDSIQVIYVI